MNILMLAFSSKHRYSRVKPHRAMSITADWYWYYGFFVFFFFAFTYSSLLLLFCPLSLSHTLTFLFLLERNIKTDRQTDREACCVFRHAELPVAQSHMTETCSSLLFSPSFSHFSLFFSLPLLIKHSFLCSQFSIFVLCLFLSSVAVWKQ